MELQHLVKEIQDEMIRIRRHIHAHPELSHEEYETTGFVKAQLEDTSIEWQELGLETGAVGLMYGKDGDGPVLMLRADLDALPLMEESGVEFASEKPNVMHACGHDIHTTVLIGAAKVLERMRDNWKGTIKFVFQPSEEKAGGASELIKAGVLENPKPDHAVCLHTWPSTDAGKIGIRPGPMTAANDTFHVTVKGTGGHGAHPEKAVDPVPVAGDIVDLFQRIISRNLSPFDPAVITAGQIDGGSADNVIATDVKVSGTVRTLSHTTRDYIKKRMKEIAHHVAAASNAEADVEFKGAGCPPVINDPHLTGLLEQSLKTHLGQENIDYLKEPSTGSEDFAYYLEQIPGMLFRLGTRNDKDSRTHLSLHNPGIVFDEQAIPAGITAMCGFASDYLNGVHK
ncbi:hippurate hydrolase [Bhargavaea beijingensis]|uniref:Hippurate hydrolase n=1 Tax=Bhargavaea beijingensis TaxID=426756 RepID=A0A1G7A700_9BACL|nr:M20 family metallopeptidase [Bhargavaea beijingensis]SDE10570.1 hippurate hydrolase [Bhargavaea beijingensis]